ncbi:MAG: response regulator [Candidatus Sumerlaeota bacterium]|nr:response regulator [Candidatus Sumerlaeota bacterium]
MPDPIRVLLVDDNEAYRQAFRRNLAMQDFGVLEAENADQALAKIQSDDPDVLVTDLQMRTRSEGLDLIRQAREVSPLLPIIMISAVGTFEEGAEASRLGAMHVIAKSKIEEELGPLYSMIRRANTERERNKSILKELNVLRSTEGANALEREGASALDRKGASAQERIRAILAMPDVPDLIKAEAYEALLELTSEEIRQGAASEAADAAKFHEVERILAEELPSYSDLAENSRDALRTAEFLYRQEQESGGVIDFSRNIGFSYCFAAENEAKAILSRKIARMLLDNRLYEIIDQLVEGPTHRLCVFFHQTLLQVQRTRPMAFTIDNVRQVFQRILEHRDKYKPDGLKALAILILCFGRTYETRTARSHVAIRNMLNLKGLSDEEETLELAQRLSRLQHYRNPYIHPEISEREALSALRAEALACLNITRKIV